MSANDEVIELEPYEGDEDSVDQPRPIHYMIRIVLVALTVPWIVVLTIALLLDPYQGEDGEALRLGTHQQLGLPECNFKAMLGIPCPSCGMTTSFSLLMHADVWNSLQANFAGTVLCGFGILFVPWAFTSAFFGRFMWVRRLELVVFRLALIFLVLLFGRWALVLIIDLLL